MNKLIFTLLASSTALALTGCETQEDRTLAAGQACLDAATQATAAQCATMVQGLTSPEAFMIRCSANFVSQGLTGSQVASAISKINSGSGGADPMVNMMSYLAFKDASVADAAITNCQASGSKSMLRLATAAKLATTIVAAGGGSLASFDPTNPSSVTAVQGYITNLINTPSPATNAVLGQTAILASTAYCSAGSSYENTEVCTNLKNALNGTSDPATIGAQLLAQLQH